MNLTLSKILGVTVILIVLGLLLEIVVKDDATHSSTPDVEAAQSGTPASDDSSATSDTADQDSQRPFEIFPASKQQLAPDFTLKSAEGKTIHLSQAVKAGPVLVDFWASYCGPCRMELPVYESLYKRYKAKGIQFYTINSYDNAASIKSIADKSGLTMPMLVDQEGQVSSAYGVDAIPVTLVIDGNRKCIAGSMGFDPAMDQDLPATLDKLIPQGR